MENSKTLILDFFATRKCAPSWIKIKNPISIIIFKAPNYKAQNFFPPLILYIKVIYYNIKVNIQNANGAINITLSILSNIPP